MKPRSRAAALAAAAASLLLVLALHGGGGGGGRPAVGYAPCLRPEALQALREAASRLNLSLEPLPGPPDSAAGLVAYVGDAASCATRSLAETVASILSSGGTVVLVGTPRQVSWVFKNETRVLMVYPLPATNSTIIYAVRVTGYRYETATIGGRATPIRLAVPEIKYRIGLGVDQMVDVLRTILIWQSSTAAPRGR